MANNIKDTEYFLCDFMIMCRGNHNTRLKKTSRLFRLDGFDL